MENRWTQAATILRPTIEVCGVRLLPFCLRHRVALNAISSPALDLDKPMTPKHLMAAVRILASSTLEEIRRPHTLREKWWVSRLTYSRSLMVEEMAKLTIYMEAQSLWPRFWVKEGQSKNSPPIPWELSIISSLLRGGCTLEEAWTMPEAGAVWLHIANLMATGADVKIVSDHEWEAMEKFKEAQANKQPQQPITQ